MILLSFSLNLYRTAGVFQKFQVSNQYVLLTRVKSYYIDKKSEFYQKVLFMHKNKHREFVK